MAVMVSEVYDALREAGASEASARAAASAIPITAELATKEDLAAVRQEIATVWQEIAAVRQEIAAVRQDLSERIAELRGDLKLIKFVYGPAVLLLLIKVAFFSN